MWPRSFVLTSPWRWFRQSRGLGAPYLGVPENGIPQQCGLGEIDDRHRNPPAEFGVRRKAQARPREWHESRPSAQEEPDWLSPGRRVRVADNLVASHDDPHRVPRAMKPMTWVAGLRGRHEDERIIKVK